MVVVVVVVVISVGRLIGRVCASFKFQHDGDSRQCAIVFLTTTGMHGNAWGPKATMGGPATIILGAMQ